MLNIVLTSLYNTISAYFTIVDAFRTFIVHQYSSCSNAVVTREIEYFK